MNRFIITEFKPTRGHSNLFYNTYKLLSKNFDALAVITKDNDRFEGSNYIKIKKKYYRQLNNHLADFISFNCYLICLLISVYRISRKQDIKNIICITYDEVSLFFFTPFWPKSLNIYLMSHSNIDNYSKSSIRKWMFNKIKKRYKHIVQCGFMADYLKNEYQITNAIVWPHPLNEIRCSSKIQDIDCVGLSYSNDETIIARLCEIEDDLHVFQRNKIKIILKSKIKTYDNGYLTVIKGRIPDERYDDLIDRSKIVFMPFPSSFNIRMSGTLVDSLTNNKYIIATAIPVILSCKKQYSEAVIPFVEASFVNDICEIRLKVSNCDDFDSFKSFHSDNNLADILFKTLTASLNGEVVVNKYDF